MRKLFYLGAVFFAVLTTQYSFSQSYDADQGRSEYEDNQAAPPADHPCGDQATGECWCLYCHYEPCYYTAQRCIQVPQYYKKKCCRMVRKNYEVKRCRMVPQYYTETVCREEPEYYCTDECKMCEKVVCDRKCKYVPKYYWKHVCGQTGCDTPCPPQSPGPR